MGMVQGFRRRLSRWLTPGVCVLATLLWALTASPLRMLLVFRALSLALFATSTAIRIVSGAGRNVRWWVSGFVLGCVLGVLPVDISTQNFPGDPRLVPFVVGLPAPETAARGKRGELFLAGCIGSGFDPEWVLVW
jgi:hypothetical protein